MQFMCRTLFILVTILICVQHVCSVILVPRNEKVKDKYLESDQHVQIRSIEKKSVVNERDSTVPLASDLVQGFDVISEKGQAISEKHKKTLSSTTVPEVREVFLGEELKPLNRTRKSHLPQRPTVCFEFPSQHPYESPKKICEPITVAREAPNDVNIVRYNPYMGIHHSSTPLVVLPPYHMSQLNPTKTTVHPSRFPPSYGPQPAGASYMPPPLLPAPTVQLPSSPPPSLTNDLSLANTTFPPTWLTDYGYHPLGTRYISPSKEYTAPLQLPASVHPPPLSEIIPVKIMLPSPWTSSFGVQSGENRYMTPPTSAQLPVSLPQYLTHQINPAVTISQSSWTPSSGIQPAENRYMFPPNQYMIAAPFPASPFPPPRSETNPAKTMLPSLWPSRYGFQPVENSYMSPPNRYETSMHLTENPPSPFTNEMNPYRTMLPSSLPPGYGIQGSLYYQIPSAQIPPRWSPSQMYYIHPPPSAYPLPYTPYPFHVYENTNKLQLPNSKTPVNASTSKIGMLHTIKEQEETHKVPTPLEEAEKSLGLLSIRSASTYPYILPQQFSTLPYSLNAAYKEHLVDSNVLVPKRFYPGYEYSPSSAMHFTSGQIPSHVPVTAKTEKFGPSHSSAALTCKVHNSDKVHNSEEKEAKQIVADDSIAILQLFLKPNPSSHNKYRESDPESVNNFAGSSNNRDSVKRPMAQYAETTNTSMQLDGLSDVRGTMTKLKEEWISSHGVKNIYDDKRNIEEMKWHEDQEKRAMQQYFEQEMPNRRGINVPALQTVQPWAWHQGYFLSSQVPVHPESFYVNGYNIRQLPCYHPGHWPDQSRVPLQWWGEHQTQLWTPQYRQQTQFQPGQQSPMDPELRDKHLLLKPTQDGLNLKEKQQDLEDNPSTGPGQGNETPEKQNRLNTVKAKLLQQYQWEAAEKRQRAMQMSLSDLPKDTNSSSKSEAIQLNARFPTVEKRKVSDIIDPTVQTNFENAASTKSTTTDVSRNNIRIESKPKPTQSSTNAVLRYSRPTTDEAKNLQGQTAMPVDNEQIPEMKGGLGLNTTFETGLEEFGSTAADGPLVIETSTGSLSNGIELGEKMSHTEVGSGYELEGRSSNQRTTSSDIRRNKKSSQIALKNNSAHVPWVNGTSDNEFVIKNQPLYKENDAIISTTQNKSISTIMASVDSSDMTTEAHMKFKSDIDINLQENATDFKYLMSTLEPEFSTEENSDAQSNQTDSSATKNKYTVFADSKQNMNNITVQEKITPGDVLVSNMSQDSTLNKRRMHTDSKEMGYSDETEHTEIYESDTNKNNAINDSVSKVTDKNMDSVQIKNKHEEYIKNNEKVSRINAKEISRSNILTYSTESSIFHDVNESTADVKIVGKNSSESLFTSKPAASVITEILAQQRDMMSLDHVKHTQPNSDNVVIMSAGTMLPEEDTARSLTRNSAGMMLPEENTARSLTWKSAGKMLPEEDTARSLTWNSAGMMLPEEDTARSLTMNSAGTMLPEENTARSLTWNSAGMMLPEEDTARSLTMNSAGKMLPEEDTARSLTWNSAGKMLPEEDTARSLTRNSAGTMLPEENTARSLTWNSAGKMLPEEDTARSLTRNSAGKMLPEENTARSLTWNSNSSTDRREDVSSNSTTSSHEVSATNKSNAVYSNESKNYKENNSSHTGNMNDLQIPFDSNNSSSVLNTSSADFRKSKDLVHDQSINSLSEVSFENAEFGQGSKPVTKTETQVSTDSSAGETSNGTSEMPDERSAISSDNGSSEMGEAVNVPMSPDDLKISYRMRSGAEEPSRTSGPTAAQVRNTSSGAARASPINTYMTNSNGNRTELFGMGRNQKNRPSFTDHQMNSEVGFPQTPKTKHSTGYLQDENVRKFKMNRTSMQSQDQFIPSSGQVRPSYHTQSLPLQATGFLVYPNGVIPTHHYAGKDRGPGQLPNMLPYSYMYPIPLTPTYSLRSNPLIHSNSPLKNIYEDSGMVAERNNKPAEKDINGQTIEGKLPFIVVLEQR
jgi:hypothetical protein